MITLKFSFCEKAPEIYAIIQFWNLLGKCQNQMDDLWPSQKSWNFHPWFDLFWIIAYLFIATFLKNIHKIPD